MKPTANESLSGYYDLWVYGYIPCRSEMYQNLRERYDIVVEGY